MNSNANFQSSESTSKANFNSIEGLSKIVSLYGQTRAWRANSIQDQTFLEPISVALTIVMASHTNLQPFKSTSKVIFKPTK